MTFTAKVQKGAIQLPPGVELPDGAEVEVQSLDTAGRTSGSPLDWMKKYAGAIQDLPSDFSAEHDHYIHGTPKRAGQ